MMSITNRSRILALVLAIAMVLSLVPVMAAAESGENYVGYATITYPAANDANYVYKISTTYYSADGKKASGEVAVKIMPEGATDVSDLFYYDIINVTGGAINLTVSLADAPKEGKYEVEFITANIDDDRNDAYFYFYKDVAEAKDALDKDIAKATSFNSVALQQKLLTLSGLDVYNRYVVNDENGELSAAFYEKVAEKVNELNPLYESDAEFVQAVEEATVIALFDSVTKSNKSYFIEFIKDSDVRDVIEDANVSDKFNSAKAILDKVDDDDLNTTVSLIVNQLTKSDSIYGDFDTMTAIADNLQVAFDAVLVKEDDDNKGSDKTITNDNPGFGGGSYTPALPTNPVIHVSSVFTDLDSNYWWVIDPLQTLYSNGFINGRTATTFAPGENITRAEFLKILLLELNMVDANAVVNFSDVNVNDWFYPYVASGANKGIVLGRSETEFAPNALITREEICIMTMRAVRARNIDLGSNVATGAFTDEADIAAYAVDDVHALKAAGIVSGRDTGAFDPKANATRAEAVKILYGVYAKQ